LLHGRIYKEEIMEVAKWNRLKRKNITMLAEAKLESEIT